LTLPTIGSKIWVILVIPSVEAERRGRMKFLVIASVKDTASMLPPAIVRQLLEATAAWTNQQKKAGKILEVYAIPGGRTIALCEHPSAEDLDQTLIGCPIGAFTNWEVYPLADFDESIKADIESAKRAEQLFPAPK